MVFYTERKDWLLQQLDGKIWHSIFNWLRQRILVSIHNVNIEFREADVIKNWLLQPIKNAMPYFSYAIFSQFFLLVYYL